MLLLMSIFEMSEMIFEVEALVGGGYGVIP